MGHSTSSCVAEPATTLTTSNEDAESARTPVLQVLLRDPAAKLPQRGTPQSAGLDLFAGESVLIPPGETRMVRTGISINPPQGTYPRLASRSSMASKDVDVTGGVVDPDYRGNIGVILHNHSTSPYSTTVGEAIAQLVLENYTSVEVHEVNSLESIVRGEGGFGSTNQHSVPFIEERQTPGCELPDPPGEVPGAAVAQNEYANSLDGSAGTRPVPAPACATVPQHQNLALEFRQWSRDDYNAPNYVLTGAGGPPRSSIVRREVIDLRSGSIIQDIPVQPQRTQLWDPLPAAPCDIRTILTYVVPVSRKEGNGDGVPAQFPANARGCVGKPELNPFDYDD